MIDKVPKEPKTTVARRGEIVGQDVRPARRGHLPLVDFPGLPLNPVKRLAGDMDFVPEAEAIIAVKPSRFYTARGYIIGALITAFLVWAMIGEIPAVAVANGKIQAVGQTKIVQASARGTVKKINVVDGDRVKKGDVLIELDPTSLVAARTAIVDNIQADRAVIQRLQAENQASMKDAIEVAPTVKWDDDLSTRTREREAALMRADLNKLAAQIADLAAGRAVKQAGLEAIGQQIVSSKDLISVTTQIYDVHVKLVEKNVESRLKVLEALEPLRQQQSLLAKLEGQATTTKADIAVVENQIAAARKALIAQNAPLIAQSDAQIDQQKEKLRVADLNLADMTIRAPVDGLVHAGAVTTLGQAVDVGAQVMQIVPADAPLEVVAYVLNSDIGFVRVGQKVLVKIDAYAYSRYGGVGGKVVDVAADAITGAEALAQQKNPAAAPTGAQSVTSATVQTSDLVFAVRIALDKTTINVDGKPAPLASGLSVVAEIETSRRKIMNYILYPLSRALPGS